MNYRKWKTTKHADPCFEKRRNPKKWVRMFVADKHAFVESDAVSSKPEIGAVDDGRGEISRRWRASDSGELPTSRCSVDGGDSRSAPIIIFYVWVGGPGCFSCASWNTPRPSSIFKIFNYRNGVTTPPVTEKLSSFDRSKFWNLKTPRRKRFVNYFEKVIDAVFSETGINPFLKIMDISFWTQK